MLKREVSSSKRPSTMKVRSKLSSLSQGNGLDASHGDAPTPKTRFSLKDKSCSSPRLKNFPAEQIKRLDPPPPPQNPQENVDMGRQMQNGGQGDTLVQQSGVQSHPLSQSFALPNQNISSMSEQQVPRAICLVNEQVNQSELVIPSHMGIASNERPPHRPHVPHAKTTLREQSPRKPVSPQLTNYPQGVHQTQVPGSSEKQPNQHQHLDSWGVENDSIKPLGPEKTTTGARYSGSYRPSVQADRNENININGPIPQRLIAAPNVSNLCPVAEKKSADLSQPQQIYQRHGPNMTNHYNNNVQGEMLTRQFVVSNPGMTSPQDVAMNPKQNWHREVQVGSCPQNPWIQNDRAQQQSHSMNTVKPGNVNPDSSLCYQHMRASGIQTGTNPHEILDGNWQAQQQHYHQQNQTPCRTRTISANNLKTPGSGHQQKTEDDKRKALRFSPAMIKDQEMLVTTMRQQGIPEEIMRRQFDALLAEQKKQLLYLEQLERRESNDSKTVPQGRRVQRKISKIEEDGKPEWMLHITPPRIPYSVIEKMRSEREVNSQLTQNAGNSGETPHADVPQQLNDQMTQENCRQTCQNSGSNSWQQLIPVSHDCSNANVINRHQTCTMTGHPLPQIGYYGYPMQQQLQQQHYTQQMAQQSWQGGVNNPGHEIQHPQRHQQQYFVHQVPQQSWHGGVNNAEQEIQHPQRHQQQHYVQQVPQQSWNRGVNDCRENIQQAQRHQQPEKTLETSSLLKLRLYKEVIRKQKQNNGLQDPETVKEAMEALKNPANRKGLEYLDNLNKKPDKPVSLNGAQDTQEQNFVTNGTPPEQYLCQPAKIPSANGLENQRNPNNPPASSILHPKNIKESQWLEYPRQRTKNTSRDCYSFIAERENGTVASSTPNDYHKSIPSMPQNPTTQNSMPTYVTHMQSRSENGGHFPGQLHQGIVYSNGNISHTGQMQQLYGNPSNYGQANVVNSQPCMTPQSGFPMGGALGRGSENVQQQYYNKNNEIQEMIMSGGLKYPARKPKYIPNSSLPPSHHNVNPRKYFNPTVHCQ